ncbi:M14 family zinc carboxypeptidase [Ekhidna sp.]|uniref:M14 family metallopeptidase n=1 Tax=Ekhidna sp. TaxID=2608089 RepID=UPI00329A1A17
MIRSTIAFLIVVMISSCGIKLKQHDFPNPVDTNSKLISPQPKVSYQIGKHLTIDNQFKGARLNDLVLQNDSVISITTKPENEPINSSPWYAFRIVARDSLTIQNLTIDIRYPKDHKHRYWPNVSLDMKKWARMDSVDTQVADDTLSVSVRLKLISDTIWIAAQPVISSEHVQLWCDSLSKHVAVRSTSAGISKEGRSLPFLKIGQGKKAIIIFSRQHPPEVTGFLALQFFLNELLTNDLSSTFLNEYCLLVYPLMNPDGVDLGHWRHNAAGVDLNRDWAYYRQPEVKAVADHIVNTINTAKLDVVLGLDFHSTWHDVYYTTDRSLKTKNPTFTDKWFQYLEANIAGYKVKDAPSGLRAPVSKGWFVSQFNIPGITYEIGDNTSLEFNKKKSSVAAEGLMKILLK